MIDQGHEPLIFLYNLIHLNPSENTLRLALIVLNRSSLMVRSAGSG